MRALYHLTIPNSPMADCEAVAQDVRLLQQAAPGRIVHLYPTRRPGTRVPRALWGIQWLPALWRAEQSVALHHVFNPDPFPFPVLRFLRRPIVYSIVGGIQPSHQPMVVRLARVARVVVVSSEGDADLLRRWGMDRARFIPPAIEADRFSHAPLPPGAPPVLLAGSAPWTVEQFASKGVDALLTAAQRRPDLHLIFLWRGMLFDEMLRRVRQRNLEDRVQVLNRRVDVNAVLAGATAAVVLATRSDVVKAYPHSLLESLAAGKPVLVSRAIPMADWVERNGLGIVVEAVDADHILSALATLESQTDCWQYDKLQSFVRRRTNQFVADYLNVYAWVVGDPVGT